MSYFETSQGTEVDLVLTKGREEWLIEIKSTDRIDETEVKKLSRRAEEFSGNAKIFYLSRDPISTNIEKVQCRFWLAFLRNLNQVLIN